MLSAMGYPEEEARGALRLSLGRTTTEAEIETASEVVPRVVASMRIGSAAVAADPLGQGVRSVTRVLVAMSGGVDSSVAAALARTSRATRSVGVWMRLHDVADTYSEFKKSCCSLDAADDARRVAGPARHPVLRDEPRARVRRRRPPAVPRRLPRRPDAEPVRRLQHVREVRGAARPGPPPLRLRGGRDRPLRPARRRRRRRGPTGPGPRRGQGPDLLPLRPPPGPARARPVPARRADEAGGPRRSPASSASRRPTSPRARRSASCRAATTATRSGTGPAGAETPGPIVDADGERRRRRTAARRPTRSASGRASACAARRAALREPDRPADEHDPAGPARGPRDADVRRRAGVVRRRGADGRDAFRADVRIRHRAAPIPATVRPATAGEPARGGRWIVETDAPVWAAAPGQAAVFYDGDVVLGGGRIGRPDAMVGAA